MDLQFGTEKNNKIRIISARLSHIQPDLSIISSRLLSQKSSNNVRVICRKQSHNN